MKNISTLIERCGIWNEADATRFANELCAASGHPIERQDDEDWIFVRDGEERYACIHIRLALALLSVRLMVPRCSCTVIQFENYEEPELAMDPELILSKFKIDRAVWEQGGDNPIDPNGFAPSDLVWMTM